MWAQNPKSLAFSFGGRGSWDEVVFSGHGWVTLQTARFKKQEDRVGRC